MNWGAVLAALAKLAELVVGLFRDRALVQSGKTAQVAETQKEVIREVQVATEARDAVRGDIAADPGVLDVDDGFQRKD